jgi:hypothetical protein
MADKDRVDQLPPVGYYEPVDVTEPTACGRCQAVVASDGRDGHNRWHEALETFPSLILHTTPTDMSEEAFGELADKIRESREKPPRVIDPRCRAHGHAQCEPCAWRNIAAGQTSQLYAADQAIEELTAEVARLRAGEDPTPVPELVEPTHRQWIYRWNEADVRTRLGMIDSIRRTSRRATACFLHNHERRIEDLKRQFESAVEDGVRLEHERDQLLAEVDEGRRCRADHTGLSRGETERLRRIESALVKLGAPNRSERGDPGGLMIQWIREHILPDGPITDEDTTDTWDYNFIGERPENLIRVTDRDNHLWLYDTVDNRWSSPMHDGRHSWGGLLRARSPLRRASDNHPEQQS